MQHGELAGVSLQAGQAGQAGWRKEEVGRKPGRLQWQVGRQAEGQVQVGVR